MAPKYIVELGSPCNLKSYCDRSIQVAYPSRFYLGFIVWGRSPEWPKATIFLGGFGGTTPEIVCNEYALERNLVHFET